MPETITVREPSPTSNGTAAAVEGSRGEPLLVVEGLSLEFGTGDRRVQVLRDVSLQVDRGEVLGLVGESGSGKTMTSMTIVGMTRRMGGRVAGSIRFDGHELTTAPEKTLQRLRGARFGMVFQQPTRALDPAFTVGDQIAETVRHHMGVSRKEAWERAVDMLDRVRIPMPQARARDYPHVFSGGMSQRVMIAMALACEPELLIADEPTTALDVSVQARILELIEELRDNLGIAVLYVTHDLAVAARLSDRITTMYAGEVVETAAVPSYFQSPSHPYSEGLIGAADGTDDRGRFHAIPGQVPAPDAMPSGCRFQPRCAYANDVCSTPVELVRVDESTWTRCRRMDELELKGVEG